MHYTLTPGPKANYQIVLTVSAEEMAQAKASALQKFQKDIKAPGFRQGHVPLDMVEQKVSPEYIMMGALEEAIHQGTKQLLAEHQDKKFIGTLYDLNQAAKDGATEITFKLDIYPEVVAKNDTWQKYKFPALDSTPEPKEIDETLANLQRQYANYLPADEVTDKALCKVACSFEDAEGVVLHTSTLYFGEEEWQESPQLLTHFLGKKTTEKVTLPYDTKKLPEVLHNHAHGAATKNVVVEIQDIRKVELPEWNEATIKKFFGNEEVSTFEELKAKIGGLISKQKEEMELMKAVDTFLTEAQNSLSVVIPHTLIEEEKKSRMESLEKKMWGADGLKKYIEKIGEEQYKKMMADIEQAAQTSLQKFFLLKYVADTLALPEVNWQVALDVEKKLYEKMK